MLEDRFIDRSGIVGDFQFAQKEVLGYSGKPLTHIINLGIGGSHLGTKLACNALSSYSNPECSVEFVSNIDPADIENTLKRCNPEQTLFIIASKSFSTQETMANARIAKDWFLKKRSQDGLGEHFFAVTLNDNEALEFGIQQQNILPIQEWVGGRYSLWSAIGLPIALYLGFDNFRALLNGAHVMDRHFVEAPLENNFPVIMGLLGIWYRNFWEAESIACLPYSQNLKTFLPWLQQLDMESNGKSVDRDGNRVDYMTGPVVFGQIGSLS